MNKPFLSKIIILGILLLTTATYSVMAAAKITGQFYINGRWVEGTMYADAICVKDGHAYAEPPWSIIIKGGGAVGSHEDGVVVPYRPLGKVSMSDFLSDKNANIDFDKNGIGINSDVELDVSIYDLSGRVVYSATAQNMFVGCNVFVNGHYTMQIVDAERQMVTVTFIFTNGEFMVNSHK